MEAGRVGEKRKHNSKEKHKDKSKHKDKHRHKHAHREQQLESAAVDLAAAQPTSGEAVAGSNGNPEPQRKRPRVICELDEQLEPVTLPPSAVFSTNAEDNDDEEVWLIQLPKEVGLAGLDGAQLVLQQHQRDGRLGSLVAAGVSYTVEQEDATISGQYVAITATAAGSRLQPFPVQKRLALVPELPASAFDAEPDDQVSNGAKAAAEVAIPRQKKPKKHKTKKPD